MTTFFYSGADKDSVSSLVLKDLMLWMELGLLGPPSTLIAAGPVGEGYSTENEDATHHGTYSVFFLNSLQGEKIPLLAGKHFTKNQRKMFLS